MRPLRLSDIYISRCTKHCACYEICISSVTHALRLARNLHFEFYKVLCLPRNLHFELYQRLCPPRNLHFDAYQVLHLPRNLHFEVYQALCLPRNLYFQVHQVLCLPRNLHFEVHQVLRLPRNFKIHQMLRLLRNLRIEGRSMLYLTLKSLECAPQPSEYSIDSFHRAPLPQCPRLLPCMFQPRSGRRPRFPSSPGTTSANEPHIQTVWVH